MSRRVVMVALVASCVLPAVAAATCEKCQFFTQDGFRCVEATSSCCVVIDATTCEFGPCIGGCGSGFQSSSIAPGPAQARLALSLIGPFAPTCGHPSELRDVPASDPDGSSRVSSVRGRRLVAVVRLAART